MSLVLLWEPNREELGWMIHTSLRKSCDSSPTSAAWNIIHVLIEQQPDVWDDFLNAIWIVFEERKFSTVDGLWKRVKHNALELTHSYDDKKRIVYGDYYWTWLGKGHLAVTFHCILSSFSDDDWHNLLYYFVDYEKSSEAATRHSKVKLGSYPNGVISIHMEGWDQYRHVFVDGRKGSETKGAIYSGYPEPRTEKFKQKLRYDHLSDDDVNAILEELDEPVLPESKAKLAKTAATLIRQRQKERLFTNEKAT